MSSPTLPPEPHRESSGRMRAAAHTARPPVTRLLSAWRSGDEAALQQLTPLVYEELRHLAHRYMRRERNSHTLQATAVVHEAFVRMMDMEVPWQDRGHFYAMAATLMRRILVDHAKGKQCSKRGGNAQICSLDISDIAHEASDMTPDVREIDQALTKLAKVDARLAQVLELHYFAGLNGGELARALSVSGTTVQRQLRLARAWMLRELGTGNDTENNDSGPD